MRAAKSIENSVIYLDLRYQGWLRNADRNTWLRDRKGLDYVNNTYILKCRATKYASSNKRRICYVCPILDGSKERVLTNFEVEREEGLVKTKS